MFVGFAIYAALESKWRLYVVFVVLSLLVKEDASLVLVPLGIWVAIKRDRRIGLITIGGSIAFMLVAMYVVMRNLIGVPTRNGWRIPFGGPRGVIDTAITNPTDLVDHLTSEDRPWYLWQMTAPFAWLFLRLPSVAAISALVLFTNVLSTFWYQHQIEYHYSLVAVPALAIGTVYALGAVRERVVWSGIHVPLRAVTRLGAGARHARHGVPVGAACRGAGPRLWYGDPDRAEAVAAAELIERDSERRRGRRALPAHPADRVPRRDLPVPDAVPRRAVRPGRSRSRGSRLEDRAERVEYVMIPTAQDAQLVSRLGRRSRRPSTSSTATTTGSSTNATPTSPSRSPER